MDTTKERGDCVHVHFLVDDYFVLIMLWVRGGDHRRDGRVNKKRNFIHEYTFEFDIQGLYVLSSWQ